MSITIIENAAAGASAPALPQADWDLASFLQNGKDYLYVIGGLVIGLLGLAVVIWAVVLICKKFFGNQQSQQESWLKIILMIIIGGAIMAGGITLITQIAAGGQKTISDLGGGFIVLQGLIH